MKLFIFSFLSLTLVITTQAQNIGIGTTTPQTKLHFVSTVGGNSGTDQSLLIENTNVSTGEAALGFRNAGLLLGVPHLMLLPHFKSTQLLPVC